MKQKPLFWEVFASLGGSSALLWRHDASDHHHLVLPFWMYHREFSQCGHQTYTYGKVSRGQVTLRFVWESTPRRASRTSRLLYHVACAMRILLSAHKSRVSDG